MFLLLSFIFFSLCSLAGAIMHLLYLFFRSVDEIIREEEMKKIKSNRSWRQIC